MKIYTKTGDKGNTTLIGGSKVSKADFQVEIYGNLDELNSYIGLLAAYKDRWDEQQTACLQKIQKDIFKIGTYYSFPIQESQTYSYPFISEEDTEILEDEIDRMQKKLPPIHDFIMPGGQIVSAQIHIARCVCRRSERSMVASAYKEQTRHLLALSYINRLSDLLFTWARYQNEAFCA